MSQFTYRDLRSLSRSSAKSPLRVVALIDYDAFYAQCESVRLGLPDTQPLGVQQWNAIIALNYAARAAGLKRGMSAEDAKLACPGIVLQHVATWREGDRSWAYRSDISHHLRTDKAALDPYRRESRKSIELIKSILPAPPVQRVEKASVDEVFLDLSAQVHGILLERHPELLAFENPDLDARLPAPWSECLDWQSDSLISIGTAEDEIYSSDWDDIALNIGSEIVRSLRQQIFTRLHYTCSAGIACNKALSKLGAGYKKPNSQTVIRRRAIPEFLSLLRHTQIRGLGGELGRKITATYGTDKIADLLRVSLPELQSRLEPDTGLWLFNII